MRKKKHNPEAIQVTRLAQIFQGASFPKTKGLVEGLLGLAQTQQKNSVKIVEVGLETGEQGT